MNQVIFIGGSGRAGTNLLKSILTSSPAMYGLAFEPRYVIDSDGIVDFSNSCRNWSPYTISTNIERLERLLIRLGRRSVVDRVSMFTWDLLRINRKRLTLPQYAAWELAEHIPGFIERSKELILELRSIDYRASWCGSDGFKRRSRMSMLSHDASMRVDETLSAFVNANVEAVLSAHNANTLIDDSTFSVLHAGALDSLFEKPKLIHLYRDPRDVVASYLLQDWAPSNAADAAEFLRSILSAIDKSREQINSERWLDLSYEELVRGDSEVKQRLEEFVEHPIEWTTTQLAPKNIGKWESQLTPNDLEHVSDLVQKYGYC